MTLDFSTSNMVVVAYPPWAGGKLLINALVPVTLLGLKCVSLEKFKVYVAGKFWQK